MTIHNDSTQLTAKGPFGFTLNPPVFYISFTIVVSFVTAILVAGENAEPIFSAIRASIGDNFGWFYIFVVNGLLLFCIYLFFGKFHNIRIGGVDAKPEFSYCQWFAMLFNAGIGLALMFYSLAEPILHYSNPPPIDGYSAYPAQMAFGITFMHWGIHGWAIYGIVGLSVAFFTFNRGLPLSLRSVLYPLIGGKIFGWMGQTTDIISTIATLFGLATTLGIGIRYVSAGLEYLFGVDDTTFAQATLVAVLTLGATSSLVLGLKKGIKNLSMISVCMALTLVAYVFVAGPTLYILDSLVQNTGYYLQNLVALGTWSEVHTDTSWQNEWTLFYWGWWFAWAPFVGIFVARISKGRTIRELIGGVILAPTLTIIIWVTVFGGAGMYEEIFGAGGMCASINSEVTKGMFVLLERYPLAFYSSLFVVALGGVFFVTSSDSGSYVINSLTSAMEGDDTPKSQRILWAVLEGIVAIALLLGGGLVALQTASLITGLPVAIMIIPMCVALHRELKKERAIVEIGKSG